MAKKKSKQKNSLNGFMSKDSKNGIAKSIADLPKAEQLQQFVDQHIANLCKEVAVSYDETTGNVPLCRMVTKTRGKPRPFMAGMNSAAIRLTR